MSADFGAHERPAPLAGVKCSASVNSNACGKAFGPGYDSIWTVPSAVNSAGQWIAFEVPDSQNVMVTHLRIGQFRSTCECGWNNAKI